MINDRNKKVLLHLSLIPHVGPALTMKIMKGLFWEQYPDLLQAELMELIAVQAELDFEQLYTFSIHDFIKKCGLTERSASDVVNGLANQNELNRELFLIEKYKVDVVSIFESQYPEILKQIYLPPVVLYCKGQSLLPFAKRISIVGSRKADHYAQQVVSTIVPDLVANDWHIVSGGAEGVDTMAHRATLDVGGQTLVVWGAGLMHPYPTSNEKLFEEVVEKGGTLISPFSMATTPDKKTFPARNRIIAGLSQGAVIVRAAEKSGALITAQYALDQGRLVFAVPGSIYDDLSVGCHELIKQGAKLINTVDDILEDFGEASLKKIKLASKEKKDIIPGRLIQDQPEDPLLMFLESMHTLDDLSIKSGMCLDELQQKLFELQLNGKVQQNFTGMWERIS